MLTCPSSARPSPTRRFSCAAVERTDGKGTTPTFCGTRNFDNPCQCEESCHFFKDCCSDYDAVCGALKTERKAAATLNRQTQAKLSACETFAARLRVSADTDSADTQSADTQSAVTGQLNAGSNDNATTSIPDAVSSNASTDDAMLALLIIILVLVVFSSVLSILAYQRASESAPAAPAAASPTKSYQHAAATASNEIFHQTSVSMI
jgi:hypothetical protein